MQAKRRRISMANMSTQPRPEERSLRRSVSRDVPASASGAANESFPSTCSGAPFETPCFRAAPLNEVCGWTASAFGRGTVRTLLLSGLSVVAIACAASFAFADLLPYLSPEAPPRFGELADANPLVAVFAAARGARDPALEIGLLAEPKFDLASGTDGTAREGALAPFAAEPEQGPAAPDIPPPVVYDPTVGPSLSPTQNALQAVLWRLVARDDRRDPLGSGDWRAARGAIAAFFSGGAYAPSWGAERGLTQAGR